MKKLYHANRSSCRRTDRKRRIGQLGLESLESRTVMSTFGLVADGYSSASAFAPAVTAYIPAGVDIQMPIASGNIGAVNATAPPSIPTNLMARAVSDTAINLSWTRADDSDNSVIIQRAPSGTSGFATLATLPAHSNTFTDTSCYPATSYTYRVIARNLAGDSGASTEQTASTYVSQSLIVAPGGLQAMAKDPSSVTLTFSDTNPNISRSDLTVDAASGQILTSPGTPFTPSEVGHTLNIAARTWWYLQLDPTSGGRVVSDQHLPFVATDVGTSIQITSGSGWIGGKYTINAVDTSGRATLSNPVTATGVTALGNANSGWTGGNYKIVSVDGQGRATLSSSPTYPGNTARSTGSEGEAPGHALYLIERSTDGVSFQLVGDITSVSGLVTWTDTNLTAGATYSYRVRSDGYTMGRSDYTSPVSATTPLRVADVPSDPTSLATVNNGPNSNTLTWTDNSGGTAKYKIERAVYSWTGTPAWTQIAVTSPGASSFTDTTAAAESFYYYRIRASNAAGDSGYTTQTIARTSSLRIGSAQVYEIGPGTSYPTLGSLNWSQLGPGDIVDIHPNRDSNGSIIPYNEKLMISVRGTEAAPIKIIGIPDPLTGALPIIDGTNATTSPQFASHYAPLETLAVVLVGNRAGQGKAGWDPGFFTISGLEIRGGYNDGQTFTDSSGKSQTYQSSTAGIYIELGDHIDITGCNIHGNGNGIFGAAQDDARDLSDILIDGNYVHDDGYIGNSHVHEMYLEGVNVTYQFNRVGPTRGSGNAIKDRSVGTVIRYNWIVGGAHELDLVEAQNQSARAILMPTYNDTYVYGNVLFNPPTSQGGSTSIVHYGGDEGLTGAYRKGVLYFDDNTVINWQDQSTSWNTVLFKTDTPEETVDARNNVIYTISDASGKPSTELDLLPSNGVGYFGNNWLSANTLITFSASAFTGIASGTSRFNYSGGNTPASISLPDLVRFGFTNLIDHPPVAKSDATTLLAGSAAVIDVRTNDTDPDRDPLSVTSFTQPHHGTVTLNADGTLTYTPIAGFVGTDGFNYIVADGRGGSALSSVAVTVIGSAPVKSLTLSDIVATTAGVSRNFTVTAKDSYGQVASGYTGTVVFTSTDVQAGLPASYTFTKGDAGSHTFTVTFKTSGVQSVTAADRDNSTILASSSVVVSPAAFKTLAVSGFTATTAGVAKTFSVSARDAYGNVVTSFTDPIGFNRAHWQDTLPVDYSFTAADAGVHTFSATLKFADSNSYISATDTKRWISGTQSGIAVSPAAMVGFAESRPTPLVAGASVPIVVTAVDAFGNAIPSYRGSVRLTSSDRQAILPAVYTFTSSDAGSHSFAVSLKTAGTQSVTAIDSAAPNLTGITWIGVNPAAATTLVIAGLPSAVTAGVMNSITVIAKDAYGNKATGYTGTVALVSNDAQAILPAEYLFTASDAGVHTFTFAAMTVGQQSLVPIDTNLVSIISTASWLTVI